MLNLRGIRAPLLLAGVASFSLACEHDITVTDPVDPSTVVVAQFDPTNPIPVLQIIPSPTALAEKPDGSGLNVTVQPCEVPSQKECLALVAGWPTTTPITLFFSGDLDDASVAEGIKLIEVAGGAPTPVTFTHTVGPRPLPNEACADGGNGSTLTYDPSTAIPPGNALVLTPSRALQPGATYLLFVESYEEMGVVKGLRSKDGKRVEASNLFSLLNAPADGLQPLTADAAGNVTITSALLRSNVSSLVLAALFPTKTLADLTVEEQATLKAAIDSRAKTGLYPLYQFFKGVIDTGVSAGVTQRDRLIFANLWHTAPATPAPVGGEVVFDPAAGRVPFPNAQLLTSASTTAVEVTIPVNPCGTPATPGCDSPSAASLKGGLNTLDGFSTTAPMTLQFSRDINPATLEGNVFMYRVGADNTVSGEVEIRFETSTATGTSLPELRIIPVLPLDQNATYVLGVKRGVKGVDGNDFRRPQLFNFFTVREPLLTEEGELNPAALVSLAPGAPALPVRLPLQCAPVSAGQPFPTPAAVVASANQIENQLRRARWAEALDAIATVTPAIPENDVLFAWTHKTQSITRLMDTIQRGLLPTVYQQVRTASMAAAVSMVPEVEITNPAIIQGTLVTTLCRAGGLTPLGFGPETCLVNGSLNPAILASPQVQQLAPLFVSNIRSMRRYQMSNYIVTRGNPYVAGTFTPASVPQPNIVTTSFWVLTSSNAPVATAPQLPVVIFQHGLGSQKEAGFFIANTLAGAGYATVLMDLPFHGARASDLVNNTTGAPCPAAQPENVVCAADGTCTGGCDGAQDPSGTGFLSANVFAARDNFRQSTIDQLTLIRLIETESMPGGPLANLDGTDISYAGQSLGGITGGNLAAYASQLGAAALNVPGGGLVNILLNTTPRISAPLFAALTQSGVCTPILSGMTVVGCEDTAGFRQFTTIAQWALDPGDPLANSIGVINARGMVPALGADKVLIQMVVPDLVVPNSTTIALGESYGFDPNNNTGTSHFQTYDYSDMNSLPNPSPAGSGCHAFLLQPTAGCQDDVADGLFGTLCATFGAQQQVARFIATGGATVGSRVPVGLPFCN